MLALEKATQKSMTRPFLSVHHRSFLWALVQELVRSMTQRFVAPRGAGSPLEEITPTRAHAPPRVGERHPSRKRDRGGPSPARALRPASAGHPGGGPKAANRGDRPPRPPLREGSPLPVDDHRAFEALLPAVHTGLLPAFSPPHGAFVMQQSTATSARSRPMARYHMLRVPFPPGRPSERPGDPLVSRLRRSVVAEHDSSAILQ